jgi:hypothetical protein
VMPPSLHLPHDLHEKRKLMAADDEVAQISRPLNCHVHLHPLILLQFRWVWALPLVIHSLPFPPLPLEKDDSQIFTCRCSIWRERWTCFPWSFAACHTDSYIW